MTMTRALGSIVLIGALMVLTAAGSDLDARRPGPVREVQATDLLGEAPVEPSAGGTPTPLNYTTGFEPANGFFARDATCWQDPACVSDPTGNCGFIDGQGSGPYPEPWAISGWDPTALIESHIDTTHPYSGVQHLRIESDQCGDTDLYSWPVGARIPQSPPLPGIVAPATFRAQIALGGNNSMSVRWLILANSQGINSSNIFFFPEGDLEIWDRYAAIPPDVTVSSSWDTSGAYQEFMVHHDPCENFMCAGHTAGPNFKKPCPNGDIDCRVCKGVCVGGAYNGYSCVPLCTEPVDGIRPVCVTDDQCPNGTCDPDGGCGTGTCVGTGSPCVENAQCESGSCTGASCVGRVDYYYGGELIHQGANWGGNVYEQLLISATNGEGYVDIDDLIIETGEPCPIVCGNLEINGNGVDHEECDGITDSRCPGRCVPPGEVGPHGEAECTCIVDGRVCDQASPLPNGTTNAPSHGNWWTFIADAPAYAVDTCGSLLNGSPWTTPISVWTGSCGTLELVATNDACYPGYDGVDPLATCYGNDYAGCTCFPTNVGQQYWVEVRQYEQYYWGILGNTTNITLSKRLDCSAVWDGGACCNRATGTCADDVPDDQCQAPGLVWTQNKLCGSDAVSCVPASGACCDRSPDLGGVCTEGMLFADCQGPYQVWTIDATCADVTCTEVRGACCDGVTGNCANGTLRSGCQGQSQLWSPEQLCANVTCDPDPGACCDHINPDPLSRTGVCTNGVIMADCQGASRVWTKGTTCSQVECVADFQAIPTVSEWGLALLAIVLVIMAKLAFGRPWRKPVWNRLEEGGNR